MVIALASTIHKWHGSTMEYMKGDMDRTTKISSRTTPIYRGQCCTLLSRDRSSESVRIFNFDRASIVVGEPIKSEMERLRRDCVFSWRHLVTQNVSMKVCLLNIVSWNLYFQHILYDKFYINYSHVMCFTEIHTNNSSFQRIEKYYPD